VAAVASAKTLLSKGRLAGPVRRPDPAGKGLIPRLPLVSLANDGAEIPRPEAFSFVDGEEPATSWVSRGPDVRCMALGHHPRGTL
jgi:hypothetical protein